MTDDNQEPLGPDDIDGGWVETGDPAQAFEALRQTIEDLADNLAREMTTIRKGVEIVLDGQEKVQQPADYSADLGQMVQQLGIVAQQLDVLGKSPILKNGPEHYARALERSGESLVKTAAQQFQHESRDLQRVTHELASQVKNARERGVQNRYLWGIGAAGVVAGILATLFLPAMLPFSAAPRVASFVMGDTPWRAGMSLMDFASAEDWRRVAEADQLVEANKTEVAACREAAAEAGEDQRCTITVAVPPAQ